MTSTTRLNEIFIQLMETLADIMTNRSEPFRARAYQAHNRTHPKRLKTTTNAAT